MARHKRRVRRTGRRPRPGVVSARQKNRREPPPLRGSFSIGIWPAAGIRTSPVEPRTTLLDALRRELGLTGTKKACDRGGRSGRPALFSQVSGRPRPQRGGPSRGGAPDPLDWSLLRPGRRLLARSRDPREPAGCPHSAAVALRGGQILIGVLAVRACHGAGRQANAGNVICWCWIGRRGLAVGASPSAQKCRAHGGMLGDLTNFEKPGDGTGSTRTLWPGEGVRPDIESYGEGAIALE